MPEQKKLSVVVPSYNSAAYIERCVSSFVHQDMNESELEVIVVNDGSTDNTVEILNRLCQTLPFLRYVTTDNHGLSRARNRGLQEAEGEYVLFVDSDDTINPHVLVPICEEMNRERLDMMLTKCCKMKDGWQVALLPIEAYGETAVMTGMEMLQSFPFTPMVYCYAYRRAFLLENHLEMKPMWHEDEEFTPRAIYMAKRIKYYPVLFYNYCLNKGSFMENYRQENMLYLIRAMASIKRFISIHGDKAGKAFFDDYIASHIIQYFKRSLKRGYTNQKDMIKETDACHLRPLRPCKGTLYTFLFNLSPSLMVWYYRTFRLRHKNEQDHE